jgi:hypothetical protein
MQKPGALFPLDIADRVSNGFITEGYTVISYIAWLFLTNLVPQNTFNVDL